MCASVCSHCPKVFPVATSATPARFKPSSHRGSLPSVHTGNLPPCFLSEPEKGVGTSQPPQEAGLRLSPGLFPHHHLFPISKSHSPSALTTGSCLFPRRFGEGPRSPLLDLLPLYLFFQLCLLLP